jgi:hypothetical protein
LQTRPSRAIFSLRRTAAALAKTGGTYLRGKRY